MKRRKMSALQRKYFGKRKAKRTSKRKVVKVAKRSRTRYVYSRAKRFYRGRKGLLGGSMGNVVVGALAGAVSPIIPQFIGGWTNPLAFGVLGYVLKKPALLTVAGYEAGKTLVGGGLSGMFGSNEGGLL